MLIQRFRDEVQTRHGRGFFKSPDDLAAQVVSAIAAKLSERYRQPPDRKETASAGPRTWNWPKPWDFGPFLASKRRDFVGREWLFQQVADCVTRDGSQALLIQADYGVGKSAFIAELVHRNPGRSIIAHHCCQHDTHDTLNPALFATGVAAQLAEALPAFKQLIEAEPSLQAALDRAGEDAASAFERAVIGPLAKLPALVDGCKVIVIDALDESLEFDGAQGHQKTKHIVELLAARANRLPKWLRILATTRKRTEVTTPMSASFESEIIDAEDTRNLADLQDYIRRRAETAHLAAKLKEAAMPVAGLVDALKSKSGGKFLYAVRALDDLERGKLSVRDMPSLPTGMDGFYLDAFQRRFEKANRDYERTCLVLGVIAAAQEPIGRVDIAAILNINETELQAALGVASDFLSARNKRYAFDHFSLAQWLTGEDDLGDWRAGVYHVDLEAAKKRFSEWAKNAVDRDRTHESDYLMRHLAAHLPLSEREEIYTNSTLSLRRWV